jgi:hypothetical protein
MRNEIERVGISFEGGSLYYEYIFGIQHDWDGAV